MVFKKCNTQECYDHLHDANLIPEVLSASSPPQRSCKCHEVKCQNVHSCAKMTFLSKSLGAYCFFWGAPLSFRSQQTLLFYGCEWERQWRIVFCSACWDTHYNQGQRHKTEKVQISHFFLENYKNMML